MRNKHANLVEALSAQFRVMKVEGIFSRDPNNIRMTENSNRNCFPVAGALTEKVGGDKRIQ